MTNFLRSKILRHFLEAMGIALLFASILPSVLDYLQAMPPWGIDFHITTLHVALLKKELSFPVGGWSTYTGAGGKPFHVDYGWLHFYPMLLLHQFLDLLTVVRLYLVATHFLFVLGCYFLFRRLSKSPLFSFFISLAIFQNLSLFQQLYFTGNGTAAANQFFLPFVILSLIIYLDSPTSGVRSADTPEVSRDNRKFFYLAALLLGLSFFGHWGIAPLFSLFAAILLLFWRGAFLQRLKNLSYFTLLVIFFTGFVTSGLFRFASAPAGGLSSALAVDKPFSLLYEWTPVYFWIFLFVLALVVLFSSKARRKFFSEKGWLAVTVALGLSIFWIALFKIGRNPIPYVAPTRLLWTVIFFAAALASLLWKSLGKGVAITTIKALTLGLLTLCFIQWFIPSFTIRSDSALSPSEAQYLFIPKLEERFKEKIVPSFIPVERKDYRLWFVGYGLGMWWPSFFDLPLTAFATPYHENDFWSWLNSSLTTESEVYSAYSEEASLNSHLYLLDWTASRYLAKVVPEFSEILLKHSEGVFDHVSSPDEVQFFELREDLASPIAYATKAPTVYVLGERETVDRVMRLMAARNINSQKAILIRGVELIDNLDAKELEGIDIVYLYDYYYKHEKDFKERPEKPWQDLEEFVRGGGKLFIDAGANAKEGESADLPVMFPISETRRGCLGTNPSFEWGEQVASPSADVRLFDPLVYEGDCWNISYGEGLKDGANTLLSQEGKPVLVRWPLGDGEVIWTGLNLPYRFAYYHNDEEAKLFESVLGMLEVSESQLVSSEFSRPKPERLTISADDGRGVLFKENYDGGWGARLVGPSGEVSKLRIRKAGPGFMYARLPTDVSGPFKLEFTYKGSLKSWALFTIGAITLLFLLANIFFGKRVSAISQKVLKNKMKSFLDDE